ncbi:hypothetical protein QEN19_002226 [Hanseniaspora menglaensis]
MGKKAKKNVSSAISFEVDDDLNLDDEVVKTVGEIESENEIKAQIKEEKEEEEEERGKEEGEEIEEEEVEEEEEERKEQDKEEEQTLEEKEKEKEKKENNQEEEQREEKNLVEISLSKESSVIDDKPQETILPPLKPSRPSKGLSPVYPPRPSKISSATQTTNSASQSFIFDKSVVLKNEQDKLTMQLKDAFPDISTKILTAITIASQNNIESCYDACLFYMSPDEFKPTFHPENFIPKQVSVINNQQLKQDELLARKLDMKYNSRPPPPPRSRTLKERDARVENGIIKRGQLPNEYDSEDEFSEDTSMKNFIDNDLPVITQNVGKTFRETSNKVGTWFKSFQSENPNERPFNNTKSNSKREVENFKSQLNNNYRYDDWGNPVFEHDKSYKIVEKSPSNESKVIPSRFPLKTPSKEIASLKPYINTPNDTAEKKLPNTPNRGGQRTVSGSGNKRLVFVETVDSKTDAPQHSENSIDDDLNLSD